MKCHNHLSRDKSHININKASNLCKSLPKVKVRVCIYKGILEVDATLSGNTSNIPKIVINIPYFTWPKHYLGVS